MMSPVEEASHTLLKGVGLYSIRMPMAAINRMVAAKAPTVTPLFCVPPIIVLTAHTLDRRNCCKIGFPSWS